MTVTAQYFRWCGKPNSTIRMYEAGTTVPKDVFYDAAATTAWDQPLSADLNGVFGFYGDGDYRMVYTEEDGGTTQVDPLRIVPPAASGHTHTAMVPPGTAWVSPVTYGAMGDGTTDDSSAFNSALNVAVATDTPLYIPAGRYFVPSLTDYAIGQDQQLRIIGAGMRLTTLVGDDPTPSTSSDVFDVTGDISIEGVGFEALGNIVRLLDANAKDYMHLRRCRFVRCGSGALWAGASAGASIQSVIVEDCEFEGCFHGAPIQGRGIAYGRFAGNRLFDTTQIALQLGANDDDEEDRCKNFVIEGNVIDTVGGADTTAAIGIEVNGRTAIIKGNVVRSLSTSTGTGMAGIRGRCRDAVVEGNVLHDAGNAEAYIDVRGDDADGGSASAPLGIGVIVRGNRLINETGTGARGIYIQTDQVDVVGNQIIGMSSSAILSSTAGTRKMTDWRIIGNQILGTTGTAAIQIVAQVDNLSIADNDIRSDFSDYGIWVKPVVGMNYVSVTGNKVRGNVTNGLIQVTVDEAMDHLKIDGNEVNGSQTGGIIIDGDTVPTNFQISNNELYNAPDNHLIAFTGSQDWEDVAVPIWGNGGDFVNEAQGEVEINDTNKVEVVHGITKIEGLPVVHGVASIQLTVSSLRATDEDNDDSFDFVRGFSVQVIRTDGFQIWMSNDYVNDDPPTFGWRVAPRTWTVESA